MKFPRVDDGSCGAGLLRTLPSKIALPRPLVFPHIAGDDCPIGSSLTGLSLFPRAGFGKAWALASSILRRMTCPVVTSYPTITIPSSSDRYAAFDSESQILYCANQSTFGPHIDKINTATQSLVAQYTSTTQYAPFGAFAIMWDNVNKIAVMQSQAHGWSTFDPADLQFRLTLPDFGVLAANAGSLIQASSDPSTGACLFVALNQGGNGGLELIQHTSHSAATILYNSGYTIAGGLGDNTTFSAAINKFLVAKLSGGFLYVDKVTGAQTSSVMTTLLGLRIWAVPGTNLLAVVIASNNHYGFINLSNEALTDTGTSATSAINGVAYNPCTNTIYCSNNLSVESFNGTTFAHIASMPTSALGMYSDKYTNLTFALNGTAPVYTF